MQASIVARELAGRRLDGRDRFRLVWRIEILSFTCAFERPEEALLEVPQLACGLRLGAPPPDAPCRRVASWPASVSSARTRIERSRTPEAVQAPTNVGPRTVRANSL
jgi:hypothetical protein